MADPSGSIPENTPDPLGPDRPRTAMQEWPPGRHRDGYPVGWIVRYRRQLGIALPGLSGPVWLECAGTVSGPGLRDVQTGITWIPVRPHRAPAGVPAHLVRVSDIVEAPAADG